jgi:very-short-patch-repair endonuclease
MSLPEVLLWQRLKGAPQGLSFRKQHPIGSYRADFYYASAKLVIEIDGISHDMGDRPARDEVRTQALEAKGFRVLRILATDVLRDPDGVAESIVAFARSSPGGGGGPAKPVEGVHSPAERMESPLHHPADGPPPRERGGSCDA